MSVCSLSARILGGGSAHSLNGRRTTFQARPSQTVSNLFRPRRPALCSSRSGRLTPLSSLSKSDATTKSTDAGQLPDGSVTAEAKIRESLNDLKAVSNKLDEHFFAALPSDLRVDASDAAFDLCRGNLPGECGQAAADALTALSQIFLGLSQDVPPLSKASSAVVTSIEGLPPQSSERLVVAKRIKSAGKRLVGMGAYNEGKAVQLGKAMVAVGEAIAAAGGTEGESQVDVSQPVRTLRFGSLSVEVTPGSTRAGAAVAVVFGLLCLQLTSGFQANSSDSLEYANNNALAVAMSLRSTLLAMGYFCTLLSAAAAVGLMALSFRVAGEQEEGEKGE